jgi:hypothetical protein
MSDEYKNHHYVPQWYQKKFMLSGETKFFYLDMIPEYFTDPRGVRHDINPIKHQGSKKCFVEEKLYTRKIINLESNDIEKYFFGEIDRKGQLAVKYFEEYSYELPMKDWGDNFDYIMDYMSTQKLRTPKGLKWLSNQIKTDNKYLVLNSMLKLARLHCAIWTEAVWLIADASKSETKFIVSDHPITVYNRECGPKSQRCRDSNDPDIWLNGTHTIFPLSLDKVLILTNLSWVRNPYQSAVGLRPNWNPFRGAIFKFTDIQIMRYLTEQEVREINFIIKSRAIHYIAAAKEDWLYPEKYISKSNWNTFGNGYLLMPDPRGVNFSGTLMWGNADGKSGGTVDEYGFKPWEEGFEDKNRHGEEWNTYNNFQGEFAKLFGPERRGRAFNFMTMDNEKDSDDFHQYHLSLQKKKYKDRRKK